ncbi:hypothetical protein Ocin01_14298 [Orchesella cincta]|uniref:Uncharacterized protein n=1 Tax=Orchesella cincta TaxID=48709 RepID=A0A1D2MHA5_ORCCI|nr:hypothetical protein Ocin01_14298 [Orchesella cincta]
MFPHRNSGQAGTTRQFVFNDNLDIEGRSSAASRYVCMALSHHFEFVSQMKCPDPKSPMCNWHFLTYAPANCNNYQGVICQHKNTTKRTCSWKASWIKKTGGLTDAIKTTALLPFGFETNIQYYRSTYKQTFGSLYCKPGYYMVRDNNTEWHIIPDVLDKNNGDIVFDYDYKETYWVVDKDKFAKPAGSNCTISKVVKGSKYKRYLEKVPCTEWHFYLCKLRFKPAIPIKTTPSDFVEPQYNWNSDWETPRKFSY